MTMFIQLLLFTCACALGAADEVPHYGDIYDSILETYEIVKDNVLSIDENVPLLNDSRRHYTEIIYVVFNEAENEDSCLGHDYYKDYQKNVNTSGPFAIAHPQKAVDKIKRFRDDIYNNTFKVLQLIKTTKKSDNQDVDKAVDDEINNNVEELGPQRDVFLELGLVATQLNNYHKSDFAQQSQNLSAHNFVVNGAAKLEKIVMVVLNLHKALYQYRPIGRTC